MQTDDRADLKIIDGGKDGPTVTVAQLVAIEFEAIGDFKEMSEEERKQRAWDMADRVYRAAQLAPWYCHYGARGIGDSRSRQSCKFSDRWSSRRQVQTPRHWPVS